MARFIIWCVFVIVLIGMVYADIPTDEFRQGGHLTELQSRAAITAHLKHRAINAIQRAYYVQRHADRLAFIRDESTAVDTDNDVKEETAEDCPE
jgi:hypothetical protein